MGYYNTLTENAKSALKQLPQFFNLTSEEINNILAKIDDVEIIEATQHKRNITYQGRLNVAKHIEDGKRLDPLPTEEIQIDRGVHINNAGFISFDKINLSTVWIKFSLPEKKPLMFEELLTKKMVEYKSQNKDVFN
jgi:hypothetical protein